MINWIKRNKLLVVLILVVVYLVSNRYKYYLPQSLSLNKARTVTSGSSGYGAESFSAPARGISNSSAPSPPDFYEPVASQSERVVIQNSSLSLLVKDVREVGDKIVEFAQTNGGFMVNASYNRPEESAYGTVTVRVPTEKLDSALDFYRGLAVKVANENIQGRDVTDQYVNIEERLSTLEQTKTKFEQILNSATEIQDILQVNREIINIQSQIDNLVGQKQALEDNAALTKITIYLSTDELALPYTPDEKFRPSVIFKLATRSMLASLQSLGTFVIWATVYSVIWIPAIFIFYFGRRYWMRRKLHSTRHSRVGGNP